MHGSFGNRMNTSKFELLPNELLSLIFDYLSSFDLFKAFFDIQNERIKHLFMSRPLVLNAKIMSHAQMNNIFSVPNFSALLRTIILNNSCASSAFYEYWTTATSPKYLTPSVERLIIMETEYYTYDIVYSLITPLSLGDNTLKYLHLVFEYPNDRYMLVLINLIETQTSVHSMILEVEKGMLQH
jgi:hypothetical protein